MIDDFTVISHEEKALLHIRHQNKYERTLQTGSAGHYAFFLNELEGIFGSRPTVESYIEEHMETISESAIANLQALRFIGCTRSQELEAVRKLSLVFSNASIRDRFLAIELSLMQPDETEKIIDDLVNRLASSPSFATTHSVISDLNKYKSDFQQRHFKIAMRACLNNNQVHWISGDDDVKSFIRFLIDIGKLQLTPQAKSKLNG